MEEVPSGTRDRTSPVTLDGFGFADNGQSGCSSKLRFGANDAQFPPVVNISKRLAYLSMYVRCRRENAISECLCVSVYVNLFPADSARALRPEKHRSGLTGLGAL